MSIKRKLICSYLILIILTVSCIGVLVANRSKDAILNEVTEKSQRITELINTSLSVRNDLLNEKVSNDLNFAEKLLNNFGELKIDSSNTVKIGDNDIPILYAGSQRITFDNKLVDGIKESTNAIATIFILSNDKLIRVSTNIIEDNQRVLGTYLDSNSECYKKIVNNEEYSTIFKVKGEGYITKYRPLLDKNKKVIGALALGNSIINVYLEKTILDMKIGKTGYVYIIDSNGSVVVHPSEKGTSAIDNDFIKNIILNKKGTIDYTYKGIKKIAYYTYYEPWDWYIITTANYDDLNSSSQDILNITILSGFIIVIIGSIIAILITNTLVKPINRLKHCMEIVSSGDLSIRSDIKSKDEIGSLSDSFNKMISENKRLLEETIKYDNLKTEFIANISHELRTPLNIIYSTVQLFNLYIKNGELEKNIDSVNNYSNTIKQNCYRLLRLVNNIIDITKIDSGFMELDLKNQNIVEVVEEVTLSTVNYAEGMGRTIIFDTNTEEKIMAFDEEKIERVILNLISNAIKFTNPGDIIEVNIEEKEKDIVIYVKDSGIGINEDELSQIFQRFKQVDSSLSRNHEGSGIGLSIVKSLIEMHGGKIEVESKINQGSKFIITLPVKFIKNDKVKTKSNLTTKTNVDKIHIEFSDIYN